MPVKLFRSVDEEWLPLGGGLAVDPGEGPDPEAPPPPPLLYLADFESGWPANSQRQETLPGSPIVLDSTDPIQGTQSVKITVNKDAYGKYGSGDYGMRSELRLPQSALHFALGATRWYGMKFKVDEDMPLPAPGKFCSIMQFHAGDSGASPVVAFEIDENSRLFAWRRGGGDGSKTHPSYSQESFTVLSNFQRGQVYDLKWQVKWSTNNDGFLRVWVNGTRVTWTRNGQFRDTSTGPTRYPFKTNSTQPRGGSYPKVGFYCGREDVSRTMWIDSFCTGAAEADIDAQLAQP